MTREFNHRRRQQVTAVVALFWLFCTMQLVELTSSCPINGCGPFGTCQSCNNKNDTECSMEGKKCICDVGYAGIDCSLPVMECPESTAPNNYVRHCYNGGTCQVQYSIRSDTGETLKRYECDCSTATGDGGSSFAGMQCEYSQMKSCEIGMTSSSYAYCVNGGQCLDMIQPGQPHPGCQKCPGFEGRHCQYKQGMAPIEELQQAQKDIDNTNKRLDDEGRTGFHVAAAFTAVAAFLFFIGCIYALYRTHHTNVLTSESAKNSVFLVDGDGGDDDDYMDRNLHDPKQLSTSASRSTEPRRGGGKQTLIENLATSIKHHRTATTKNTDATIGMTRLSKYSATREEKELGRKRRVLRPQRRKPAPKKIDNDDDDDGDDENQDFVV